MVDTPTTGDPVNPGDTQTTVTTTNAPAAPVQDNASAAEVEQLRLEKQKAETRLRQLENEKLARDKADQEAQQKQLEENNEWKQIAEQEKAKREAYESERQEAEAKETKRLAEETIFAEFSQEAIEVAKDAGLTLKDDSDEAKADFKQRMEKISTKVATTAKVTPNNPGVQEQPNADRTELVGQMRAGNKEARDKVIGSLDVLDRMRAQAGYTQQQ